MNAPLTPSAIEAAKALAEYSDLMPKQREADNRTANELRERWNRRSIMKGPGNEVL